MRRQQPQPKSVPISAGDRVTVDNGTTEYTVQAVSRAGQDVYVTDGDNTSVGTWVGIRSITLVDAA